HRGRRGRAARRLPVAALRWSEEGAARPDHDRGDRGHRLRLKPGRYGPANGCGSPSSDRSVDSRASRRPGTPEPPGAAMLRPDGVAGWVMTSSMRLSTYGKNGFEGSRARKSWSTSSAPRSPRALIVPRLKP